MRHNFAVKRLKHYRFARVFRGGKFDFSQIFETIKALFSSIGPVLTETLANANPYNPHKLTSRGSTVLYQ